MKLKEKTSAASTTAGPAERASNWTGQVVAVENSNSNTEGPPLQAVPVVFASNDLRHMDAAGRERSKLAVKVIDSGGKELKKDWHNRASERDLRRHLKRQGVATARDKIRRVVTVTAKHPSNMMG
jgi:hypothetical protein